MTSTPERIERRLIRSILRGEFRAAERLPTMRALAARFATTVPTIQRVVSRLEARGLVAAVQGSALHLNDPLRSGDLSLVPAWLAVRVEAGDAAARFLDEFLELRRTVAVALLVKHRERIVAGLADAHEALAAVMAAAESGTDVEFAKADVAFARSLLRPTDNVPAILMLNTLERLLTESPLVAEALYGDRERTVASMATVLQALTAGGGDTAAVVEAAMKGNDDAAVQRFAHLAAEAAGDTPPVLSPTPAGNSR